MTRFLDLVGCVVFWGLPLLALRLESAKTPPPDDEEDEEMIRSEGLGLQSWRKEPCNRNMYVE
jgi:hypothetical protein